MRFKKCKVLQFNWPLCDRSIEAWDVTVLGEAVMMNRTILPVVACCVSWGLMLHFRSKTVDVPEIKQSSNSYFDKEHQDRWRRYNEEHHRTKKKAARMRALAEKAKLEKRILDARKKETPYIFSAENKMLGVEIEPPKPARKKRPEPLSSRLIKDINKNKTQLKSGESHLNVKINHIVEDEIEITIRELKTKIHNLENSNWLSRLLNKGQLASLKYQLDFLSNIQPTNIPKILVSLKSWLIDIKGSDLLVRLLHQPKISKTRNLIDILDSILLITEQKVEKLTAAKEKTHDPDDAKFVSFLVDLPEPYQPNDLVYALDQSSLGAKIYNDIKQGNSVDEYTKHWLDYRDAIIALQWHIFNRAICKGHGFMKGIIVLLDSGNKFYNFLKGYVDLVNPNSKDATRSSILTFNKKAYDRPSSHFSEQQLENVGDVLQFGIDVRNEDGHLDQTLLPCNKAHILFGRLGDGKMFVRWEVFGTTMYNADALKHLGALVESKNEFGDANLKRKEHMTMEIRRAFRKALGKEKLTSKQLRSIKAYGVSSMRKALPSDKAKAQFDKYLTDKKLDHLDHRKANEVILVGHEL